MIGFALLPCLACAQGGRGGRGAPPTAKAAAPVDMTGYWESMITQNWRLRMIPPARGDYMGIPLSPAAKAVADAWDPAKDESAGLQCKYYGAASIMTQPERLHITWQDDNTLQMEIDAGTQSRYFHFGDPPAGDKPSWQGDSVAVWQSRIGGRGGMTAGRFLKVSTTHLLPGYLRKNGVPYGSGAKLTEYYDLLPGDGTDQILIVTSIVEDPVNLDQPLILTAQFKKEADGSHWAPKPCSARW